MKSRNPIWIVALCLLSATVIAISLKSRPTTVAAATPADVGQAKLIKPVAHVANAELRAAIVRNALTPDVDAVSTRVPATPSNRTVLPPVEEFTIIPPNPAQGITKTMLAVRFPQAQAVSLASNIPMALAQQNVILQRSAMAPNVFVTALDFDWQRFIQEQALRKEAVGQGRMTAVFDGRKYVGQEKLQFIEPEQIEQALQSHQPVQFTAAVLQGSAGFDVFPDHQLVMNSLAVVEDVGDGSFQSPARTYDQCISGPPRPRETLMAPGHSTP